MTIDRPAPAIQPNLSNLLIAGLYSPGSGLTNVISVLLRELSHEFSVSALGFNPDRSRGIAETTVSGCPVSVQSSPAPVFLSDPAWLETYMQNSRPEAVIVIGPAFLTTPFLKQLQKYHPSCRIILYLSTEGEIVNREITRTITLADACVFYTESARKNVAALCSQVLQTDSSFRPPEFYVAGHGVDTTDFFSLSLARKDIKRKLFPDRPELHNAFLILNANRLYYRKRLDLTVKGFAKFALDHSNTYLYLHTGRTDSKQLAELKTVIEDSGAAERILLNALTPDGASLSLEKLNLLYNACDVGITTAMGEGWGLTSFEHAATGAAQIVPDHTSFSQNWTGAAEMVPTSGREHIFYEFADMFTVSPDDVAFALERLYADEIYRDQMAQAAYSRALEPKFRWENVGAGFRTIVAETLSRPKRVIQAA